MKEAFVNICNIPTHIITCGTWVEESLDNVKEVAICITGNPGLPGFYTEFCNALHERLEKKIPVWVVGNVRLILNICVFLIYSGHLGHENPPETSLREVPQLKGNEELFDLDSQVRHKIEFIEKYVPEHTKIHLIGHSIGAWMVLQILRNESVHKRIKKCYLLFPTIERMIESPNGWVFTKIALPLYSVFGFIISLLNRLPEILKIFLVQIYFWFAAIPNYLIGTALKYAKPSVVEKVVFLAEDEMARVRALQRDIIQKNMHLLKFYYGTTDGWVPIKYFTQLKEEFPDIDADLDVKKIDHSFVLRYSKPMACIVGDFIIDNSEILGMTTS
uniref:Lipid droplet-associated hydrolase n=1 Tax=Glossina pallidipes TaxID=7398 RepID=A0A1A9ZAV3_GLOPL